MISIIIPTFNHFSDCLRPCLESIIKYTSMDQVEVIVVANGCTDGTEEYIKSLGEPFRLISYPLAIGYPKSVNAGLKIAIGDFFVLLNNDTVILESQKDDWLRKLQEPFQSTLNCGVTGPSSLWSYYTKEYFIIFFCAMISRKVLESVGYLNEIFSPGSGEDLDFCCRAILKGFTIIQVPQNKSTQIIGESVIGEFPIWHKAEATVHGLSNWKEILSRNTKILNDMYAKKLSTKIGVITPLYNDKDRILRSINSVKLQDSVSDGAEITHYIYSDCSSDGSNQIVEEYIQNNSKEKIKFIKGTERKGQSHARNVLLDQAVKDGIEYIAFLDSDDQWLLSTHISESISIMDKGFDFVYGRPRCFNDKGEEGHPFGMAIPRMFIGKQLEYLNFIWISGVVTKAACFKENRFDSALNGLEDWDMWYRLSKQEFKFISRTTKTFGYQDKPQGEATKSIVKMGMIKDKHKFSLTGTRLNIACGKDYQQGYINADLYESTGDTKLKLDACFDAREIPYDDSSVDEIRALHIIEHFDFQEAARVLSEWYRVLKPGGKLILETPDFLESCRAFVNGDEGFRIHIYGHFFCFPWEQGQTHKFLFTETQLRTNLTWAGFKNITRISPMSNYVTPDIVNLFLAVEAMK